MDDPGRGGATAGEALAATQLSGTVLATQLAPVAVGYLGFKVGLYIGSEVGIRAVCKMAPSFYGY